MEYNDQINYLKRVLVFFKASWALWNNEWAKLTIIYNFLIHVLKDPIIILYYLVQCLSLMLPKINNVMMWTYIKELLLDFS